MDRIYLDNAATTPVAPEVIDVMHRVLRDTYGNPSSIHAEGRSARAAIEGARKQVAQYLGASIGELFFTSCGTESNNMVLKNAVRDLGVRRIISARTEHHCVLHSLNAIGKAGEVEVIYLQQDRLGRVDLDQLRDLLPGGPKTLVSVMHANNEIGTMIDLNEVGALCEAAGALFHSDTVQTIGYYPFDLANTPVHFITGSAHKFHGPKGVGFVYIDGDHILRPFIDGGAQERNMRGGTENIHGILGLAKALELAAWEMERRRRYITELRQYLASRLQELFGVTFNGDWQGLSHYKLLSVSFPSSPRSELLLLNLDIAGIAVSGGSACSSGADAGSHVLEALYGPEDTRKTIRFSLSHYNTREEIDRAIEKMRAMLPQEVG